MVFVVHSLHGGYVPNIALGSLSVLPTGNSK